MLHSYARSPPACLCKFMFTDILYLNIYFYIVFSIIIKYIILNYITSIVFKFNVTIYFLWISLYADRP